MKKQSIIDVIQSSKEYLYWRNKLKKAEVFIYANQGHAINPTYDGSFTLADASECEVAAWDVESFDQIAVDYNVAIFANDPADDDDKDIFLGENNDDLDEDDRKRLMNTDIIVVCIKPKNS